MVIFFNNAGLCLVACSSEFIWKIELATSFNRSDWLLKSLNFSRLILRSYELLVALSPALASRLSSDASHVYRLFVAGLLSLLPAGLLSSTTGPSTVSPAKLSCESEVTDLAMPPLSLHRSGMDPEGTMCDCHIRSGSSAQDVVTVRIQGGERGTETDPGLCPGRPRYHSGTPGKARPSL